VTDRPTRAVGAVGVMAEQCLVQSPRGVAAAAAPAAARIAAGMLERGGNAFDAVVAAALAETVLLPPKCGLAGDLVALVWARDRTEPEALLAIGGAPAGLAAVAARGELGETGPMAVGVPGAPAGYLALASRARFDLGELAAPAIEQADEGFCWSTVCTVLAEDARHLIERHQPDGARYLPGGRPITPGTVVALPGLARVLEALVADRDGFLRGRVGRAIVERVRSEGGVLEIGDFEFGRAEWVDPVPGALCGAPFWATPAPTHGPSLVDAVGRLHHGSGPAHVHEAVTSAIERRRMSLADPSGTSMVSAVDGDGTMVAVIHSNSYPQFGSGLIVDEFDLVLANRAGRGFTPTPGHPNFPEPGRRPATTLHAWAYRPDRAHRFLGATPGGANQMPWNAQSLARLTRGGAPPTPFSVAESVVAPRWQLDADGGLTIEAGFAEPAAAELAARSDSVRRVERWALRSAMQIVGELDGRRVAAADPRTVSAVVPL
jgi:gamma-glutamyltranspeptidase/glutathione hydrolase